MNQPNVTQNVTRRRFVKSTMVAASATIVAGTNSSAFAQEEKTEKPADRKTVLCSTTQVADFCRQVVGDRWNVNCVLGAGEDPHKYRTGNDDVLAAGRSDLCLQNGWHLEGNEWMATLAENANKPLVTCVRNIKPIDLNMDGILVKDPHAWFDPRNAWKYTVDIRDAIIQLDPDHAEEYKSRAELFQRQLKTLDTWIKKEVNNIPLARRVLVTHHDAFGYFCERYEFKAMSPVAWTTAELGGITLKRRQEIIKAIGDLNVKSIFVESTINSKALEGIAKEAGVKIGGRLYSDAMGAKGSAGETYLGMMRENVLTIVSALK